MKLRWLQRQSGTLEQFDLAEPILQYFDKELGQWIDIPKFYQDVDFVIREDI